MTEEELNSLRKKMAGTDTGDEAKGFGVSNVNQRIKYYYGEEYGVFFESKENEGTNATIIIPAKNIQLLS
jgi:two-component system sensor histidine kinase YesM